MPTEEQWEKSLDEISKRRRGGVGVNAITNDLCTQRLIYSDWLSDEGQEDYANFQKWLASTKTLAYMSPTYSPYYHYWFSDEGSSNPKGSQFGDLPKALYNAFRGSLSSVYATRLEAEKALFRTWLKWGGK